MSGVDYLNRTYKPLTYAVIFLKLIIININNKMDAF